MLKKEQVLLFELIAFEDYDDILLEINLSIRFSVLVDELEKLDKSGNREGSFLYRLHNLNGIEQIIPPQQKTSYRFFVEKGKVFDWTTIENDVIDLIKSHFGKEKVIDMSLIEDEDDHESIDNISTILQ